MDTTSPIIFKAIDFVKKEMNGNDASHDWGHIERVLKLSRIIAIQENIPDLEIVELAAILHDVGDWKYSGSETSGPFAVKLFLQNEHLEPSKIDKIIEIIKEVSFKEELPKCDTMGNDIINNEHIYSSRELAVVQDADRLDALGAIGIARAFCFSGRKGRAMYDPRIAPRTNLTKEEYIDKDSQRENTTINHFYEKLLLLKDMMKTSLGKKMAIERHAFMETYLKQFISEWHGDFLVFNDTLQFDSRND
jgi:uncharacterized protein